MAKDYYKILDVDRSASPEEIKKAFRKLAHKFHPDKAGGDEAKFKELNEAFQVLGNPEKRRQYDQFGTTFDQAGPGFGQGFGGPFGGGAGFDFGNVGDLGDILGDLFGGMGGGTRRRSGRARGADIEVDADIDFSETVFGAEKILNLYKSDSCRHCQGNGAEPGTKIISCATCGGSGQVQTVQRTVFGSFQSTAVCRECHGEGKRPEKPCRECGGIGATKQSRQLKIKIPAGIDNGEVIKLSGQGERGAWGGRAGDLYVHVRVRPDARFKRDGLNIISHEHISFTLAALGGSTDIETIEGRVSLKIPAGTQGGQIFKLNDKGIPALHGGGRGDQLVEVLVKVPKHLSREQKKLIEQLGEME
ncbi:MAG: molecular chaperone DnaJ [Patescibacteria group bacterium]|nr:molecular chaperone DnaJ [Patescibacteria group bacterium]